uniref:Prominin 1 b n=1 Tax=Hippocampus comes TaxID=109280 RepID=A0A3Q2XK43_HIPCM
NMVQSNVIYLMSICGAFSNGPAEQRSPPPVEPLDFGFVPAAVYDTHAYYEPGTIGILFHMVHAFLYIVQPNSFPKGQIIRSVVSSPTQQGAYYELGFLVCATVGVLFVVLVPVLGMCFCVCRCCENCGGEMHQRQRKNADCRRALFPLTYSLIQVVQKTLNSLFFFFFWATFLQQIEYMTAQYTTVKNKVLSELDNIGPLLGGRIHSQLEKEVVPSLDTALRMAGGTPVSLL